MTSKIIIRIEEKEVAKLKTTVRIQDERFSVPVALIYYIQCSNLNFSPPINI